MCHCEEALGSECKQQPSLVEVMHHSGKGKGKAKDRGRGGKDRQRQQLVCVEVRVQGSHLTDIFHNRGRFLVLPSRLSPNIHGVWGLFRGRTCVLYY